MIDRPDAAEVCAAGAELGLTTGADVGRETLVKRAFATTPNTAHCCATGHPGISGPPGTAGDGRPIGAMFIGRKPEEKILYRTAAAGERLSFAKTMTV